MKKKKKIGDIWSEKKRNKENTVTFFKISETQRWNLTTNTTQHLTSRVEGGANTLKNTT